MEQLQKINFLSFLSSLNMNYRYNKILMFKMDRENFQHILQQEPQTHSDNHFCMKPLNYFTFINKQKIKTPSNNKPQQIATLVALPAHTIADILEVYQWRSQTEYPIVRAHTTGIIFNKTQSIIKINLSLKNDYQKFFQPEDILYLEVFTQPVQLLSNFGPLTFGMFSYAFKEAIVGFQRLYALFGPFSISPSMIVVNNERRLKVWLSANYHQNTKNQLNSEAKKYHQNLQKVIVSQLKQVFLMFAQNNATYREFFTFVQHTDSFLGLLKKIEEFLSLKKILIVKYIKKQTHDIIKRPLSPTFTLLPQKNESYQAILPKRVPFNKRMTVGDGAYGQRMLQNLRSMKNLNVVISQLQTRQSLSTKSQFISNNVINDFQHKIPKEINRLDKNKRENQLSHKMKKLDSLEKNLQDLFENEKEGRNQATSKKLESLAAYGKQIKCSRFIQ